MDIQDIANAVQDGRIRITEHADEEAADDDLGLDQIRHSVLNGEIIEDYPTDRPFPSCLIFGRTSAGDPVHSVWGYNAETRWAVLITVYRPDPNRWIDWRERKQP